MSAQRCNGTLHWVSPVCLLVKGEKVPLSHNMGGEILTHSFPGHHFSYSSRATGYFLLPLCLWFFPASKQVSIFLFWSPLLPISSQTSHGIPPTSCQALIFHNWVTSTLGRSRMPACPPLRLLLGDLMVSSSSIFLQTLDIVPEIVSLPIFLPSVLIYNMKIVQIVKEKANILGDILQCVAESTCVVYIWLFLLVLHPKHLLHPTSSPQCHCCLLCPSCQCLLPVLLQMFPSCIHLFFKKK